MGDSHKLPTVSKEFLLARAVALYTRYGANGVTHHGTGFLLELSGRSLVVTAAHVIERYLEKKNAGEDAWLEISAGDGRAAVRSGGAVVASKRLDDIPQGENRYRNRDIAFIVLLSEEREYLSESKIFFTKSDLDTAPMAEGDGFVFCGAPAADRSADILAPTPYVETVIRPFTTTVLRVDGHHVVGEGFVELGHGDAHMRGVSGSPVVDDAQRLRGVLFEGSEDRDEIGFCAIAVLFDIMEAVTNPACGVDRN